MNQNQNQGTTRNYIEVAAGGSDNTRWEPTKNEQNPNYPMFIEGYYKSTKELPGKQPGSVFTVAEIQMVNPDGSLGQCVDVSGGKVLDEKLRVIPLGSFIMIKYLGKVQGKLNAYNDWKTLVDEGAMPLHQLMGVAAPVQHFQQQAPVAQQQAPVFQQSAPQANPFQQVPAAQQAQQQAAPVFNQQVPVFGQPAVNNAAPAFNQVPTQNSAQPFQQQVPVFNQSAPAFNQQAPIQNNGQMPGMQGQGNPFAQQNDDLPFK